MKIPKIIVDAKTPRAELYLLLLINSIKGIRLGNMVKLITLTSFFDSIKNCR